MKIWSDCVVRVGEKGPTPSLQLLRNHERVVQRVWVRDEIAPIRLLLAICVQRDGGEVGFVFSYEMEHRRASFEEIDAWLAANPPTFRFGTMDEVDGLHA